MNTWAHVTKRTANAAMLMRNAQHGHEQLASAASDQPFGSRYAVSLRLCDALSLADGI